MVKMVGARVAVVALLTLVVVSQAEAKRGCAAFGHSCYGGHGKRSGDSVPNEGDVGMESLLRRQAGQEEVPRTVPGLPAGDAIIPVRDGGAWDRDDNDVMKEVMKFRLRNIVKHWMDNYRRSQANSEEGYYPDPTL